MTTGSIIRKKRNEKGLTQKELAEQLNVTPQAVSRWEADEVEPSIDTLKGMASIFACSIDELFDYTATPTVEVSPTVVEVEKVVYKEPQKALGVCAKCGKIIYEMKDLFKVEYKERKSSGRSGYYETKTMVLCANCNEKRNQQLKKEADEKEAMRRKDIYTRRIHGFIWPGIIALAVIGFGIAMMVLGNNAIGIASIVGGVMFYPFLGTMIMDNTFLTELWMDIASWGFVRMPGIIFSLSFNGLIFLIVAKIVLAILAFLLAAGAILLATVLCMILGIFVYPLSLYRSFNYISVN